jgi:hypothetical protein
MNWSPRDKSPGVLLASGYIAGGALTGIVILIVSGAFASFDSRITAWAEAHNPFYAGPSADLLALIPFAILTWFLYMVGREAFLSGRANKRSQFIPGSP